MLNIVSKTDKYEIREYDNEIWLKIFFHNHSTKVNFENESEARHCNSEFKYSILDKINPSMKIKKKYEFIMEFPDDNVYIRWEQNRNPVKELDGKNQADGFKMISNNLPSQNSEFRGLTRSTIRDSDGVLSCFLDGNPMSYKWYYAIGMYKNSINEYKYYGIPTYKSYTSSLRLWIKIDPSGNYHVCTYHKKRFPLNVCILLINLLLIGFC